METMAKKESKTLTSVRLEAIDDGIRAACKDAMQRQGWTYRELADECGVNYNHIYTWMERAVGLTTMRAWPIMQALGLVVIPESTIISATKSDVIESLNLDEHGEPKDPDEE